METARFRDTYSGAVLAVLSKLSSIGRHPLVVIVLIGFIVRFVIGIFATYNFDIQYWAVTIGNIGSGNGLYGLDGYYYTQPWGYLLGTISAFGELIGVDNLTERITEALMVEQYTDWHFTANLATLPFIMLIKTPLILCDIAVAYVIRWIVLNRTSDQRKGNIAFALWFLCPLTIITTSVSAMFDNFMVLMLLLSIVFLMQDRCFLAGAMFSLSALTKFFPAFLIFVLVAYIFVKHRDDGLAVRNVVLAAAGAAIMFFIIMLPQIINGEVAEAFSFITSRANSGMGSGLGILERYGTILAYVAFAAISALLALRMYRDREDTDADGTLMFVLMINVIVLFLYPSTPQYMLLLLPFVIYHMAVKDWNTVIPGSVLVFGSCIFALASNFTLFLSVAAFTGIPSLESVTGLVELFQSPVFGLSPMSWMYYIGGIAQYAGTLLLLFYLYKHNRSRFRPFIIKGRSETSDA